MRRVLWSGLLPLALVTSPATVAADSSPNVVAALDYGTFRGAHSARYNITYWQRIPFAAPPVGPNRFRAPQPPAPVDGVYDSNRSFDMCPQRTTNGSEDCLYLSVYSRPFTASTPPRPVVVVFHGGGFIRGSASPFSLPPSAFPVLNTSSAADLVFVYPNHRLNVFGFLPGRAVARAADAALNPGLLDQAAAVRWAARHAAAFGGDPARVAIWGQSAGGGSVLAQLIAKYPATLPHPPRDDTRPPFRAALASSPYWPRTYALEAPEAQRIYDSVAARVGCGAAAAAGDAEGLACLRAADVQALRDAAADVAAATTYTTSSYGWAPVVDGAFLAKPLSAAAVPAGVAVLALYNAHEGESFVPETLRQAKDAEAAFAGWLGGFLPGLGAADIAAVGAAYPPAGSTETIKRYEGAFARAGLVYRDAVLACPAYWAARGAGGERGWLAEYSMNPSKHASDTSWWNTVNKVQEADPLHYRGFTGALASFFATGDPNALKLTAAGVPGLPPLASGKAFNINDQGFAQMALPQLEKRCELWRRLAPQVPL